MPQPFLVVAEKRDGSLSPALTAWLAGAGITAPAVAAHDTPEGAALEALAAAPCLILPGGGDFSPESGAYEGAPPDPAKLCGVHQEREKLEFALLRAALAAGKPVLAVCRGFQALNVALGGTLHADLPSALGAKAHAAHQLSSVAAAGAEPSREHPIDAAAGGFLEWVLEGAPHAIVNSHHHQGVRRLAGALAADAAAPDGVVEAAHHTENLAVWGVQFHPERMAAPWAVTLPARWIEAAGL